MQYLDGMKYLNLSCCANTGFEGYYAIADFMLRRNPSIKVIVLHTIAMPYANLMRGGRGMGGADRIENSFTDLWAYLSPPSMALRRTATDAIYSQFGALRSGQTRLSGGELVNDMIESIRKHRGWWRVHDRPIAPTQLQAYWHALCGDDGMLLPDEDQNYIYTPWLGRRSYVRVYLQHFAELAASYNAKLVVIFNPFPCNVNNDYLSARRADLEFVRNTNKNFEFEPKTIAEVWPKDAFVSWYHLKVGYDEKNSRREGQLLAQALGIQNVP